MFSFKELHEKETELKTEFTTLSTMYTALKREYEYKLKGLSIQEAYDLLPEEVERHRMIDSTIATLDTLINIF